MQPEVVQQVAVVAFHLSDIGSMVHFSTELFQHGDIVFPVSVCVQTWTQQWLYLKTPRSCSEEKI